MRRRMREGGVLQLEVMCMRNTLATYFAVLTLLRSPPMWAHVLSDQHLKFAFS